MTELINCIRIGSPGSGKSVGGATTALNHPGAEYIADPHTKSLVRLILEHAEGEILYDNLSDLRHPLPFKMLRPYYGSSEIEKHVKNHKSAQLFTEIVMRRRGADITSLPLVEEWLSALFLLFLFQDKQKSLRILPCGFEPESNEFKELVKGCTLPVIQRKFQSLAKLSARALRAEVGSASRLIRGIFRSPHFELRCDGEFDLDAFVKAKGKLLVEKGEDADEDATRTIICARTCSLIEYAKSRSNPYPPILVMLDECTNAGTVGAIEAKAAGETRKNGLFIHLICQHPNFPGGTEGYFQNFPRKEIFRTSDRDLAKKMAAIIASEFPDYTVKQSAQIQSLTSRIMTLETGWRFITGPGGGPDPQYVEPLKSPWPDWPGLRDAMLQEKLECVYRRTEYQRTEGGPSESSSKKETPRQTKSPDDSSAVDRWRRLGKTPTEPSAENEDENESTSEEQSS